MKDEDKLTKYKSNQGYDFSKHKNDLCFEDFFSGVPWTHDSKDFNIFEYDPTKLIEVKAADSIWEQYFGALPRETITIKEDDSGIKIRKDALGILKNSRFNPHIQNVITTQGDYLWGDFTNKFHIGVTLEDYYNKPSIYFRFCPHENLLPIVKEVFDELFLNLFEISTEVKNSDFHLIAQENNGSLYTIQTECRPCPIKDDRYDLFYGKDFPHQKFLDFFEEKNNLLLLHGEPGTGKSNYIKNLISFSDRKVIYISPSMLSVIASPGFMTFVMENKDSVLLIEDAEEVLSIDRNSATNNLLGITDGFLKDSLNLKVIATFNCDIGKIDPALTRKGRLHYEYKFRKLSEEEAWDLVEFMELKTKPKGDMSLAEIFNPDENHLDEQSITNTRRIGFGS